MEDAVDAESRSAFARGERMQTRDGFLSGASSPEDEWVLNVKSGSNLNTTMQTYPDPRNCTHAQGRLYGMGIVA